MRAGEFSRTLRHSQAFSGCFKSAQAFSTAPRTAWRAPRIAWRDHIPDAAQVVSTQPHRKVLGESNLGTFSHNLSKTA